MSYFTFENLYRAYRECRRRKTATLNHLRFAENLEENLLLLERELQNRAYKPGRSIAFVVQKPKPREIFAADFRDRVVHHLLYNYLAPIFERIFIYDSWACRKGKGTHRAIARLRSFCNESERERESRPAKLYFLQADIRSFFTSIDQRVLYDLIAKKIKNEEILWLTRKIIFHDCAHDIPPKIQSQPSLFDKIPAGKSLFKVPRGQGLPIGNLTSQFFANVYLNELDQFVKHKLRAKHYLRYVDDFIILEELKELIHYRRAVNNFLRERLALSLHPKKRRIAPLESGIDFVGYVVRADYVLVRRRVVGQFRFRMDKLTGADKEAKEVCLASYRAHFKWASSYGLQRASGTL